ncbi:MAG: tetratricopeptide repeat protein [bacterium]
MRRLNTRESDLRESCKFFRFIIILLIIYFAFLAYSNSFMASFQCDDFYMIVRNKSVKNFDLATMWKQYAGRIIPFLTFSINYYWGGLNVIGYHIFNFIVHVLVAINVFWLVLLLYKTPALQEDPICAFDKKAVLISAALVSIIFVTHPIQTQAVTYIWQRCTSLSALFYLLSMNLFLKGELYFIEKRRSWLFFSSLSLCSGILACFTKPNAFTLPFMIFILWALFLKVKDHTLNQAMKRLVWWVPVLLIVPMTMLLHRSQELIDIQSGAGGGIKLSILEYFYTQLNVVWTYVGLLILPIFQKVDYNFPISLSLFELRTLFSLLFHCSLGYIALHFRKKRPLLSFCIIFFYLTLAVESSFVPLMDVIFEHRLYLPSVGASIAFSWIVVNQVLKHTSKAFFEHLKGEKLLVIIILLGFICYPLIYLTNRRNEVWSTQISLWEDNVLKTPHKARPYYMLGYAYDGIGDIDNALYNFKKAEELGFRGYQLQLKMGNIYEKLRLFDKALLKFREAEERGYEGYKAKLKIGAIYEKMKLWDNALLCFKKAIEFGYQGHDAQLKIGIIYGKLGKFRESIEIMEGLKEELPEDYSLFLCLGSSYANEGEISKAIHYYNKAMSLSENNFEAHLLCAKAYCNNNQMNKGMKLYSELLNNEKLKVRDRIIIADELHNLWEKTEFAEEVLIKTLKNINCRNKDKKNLMEIYFRLTQIYIKKGELKKAKDHWEKAKRTGQDIPRNYFASIEKYLYNN